MHSNPAKNFKSGFVTLLGPANAGKSTLLNAILGKKVSIVSPKEQTTRTRVLGVKTLEQGQMVLTDTPGFFSRKHRGELSRLISRSLRDALSGMDVCVLVVDGAELLRAPYESFQRVLRSLKERKLTSVDILVINKIDCFSKADLLPLLSVLGAVTEAEGMLPLPEFIPISALRRDGLKELEQAILERLPEGEQLYPDDVFTDQPEEFFVSEIIREKLFYKLREEIPYSAAIVIRTWEEEGELLKIHADIVIERDSQKKIVIGDGGSMLGSIGESARKDLEYFFQCKVFLKLFVRVEENWSKTTQGLRRAGYLLPETELK